MRDATIKMDMYVPDGVASPGAL